MFEVEIDDGSRVHLALLEAKQNRRKFPSLAKSQLRILNVE